MLNLWRIKEDENIVIVQNGAANIAILTPTIAITSSRSLTFLLDAIDKWLKREARVSARRENRFSDPYRLLCV